MSPTDDPDILARNFITKHSLKLSFQPLISNHIRTHIQKHKSFHSLVSKGLFPIKNAASGDEIPWTDVFNVTTKRLDPIDTKSQSLTSQVNEKAAIAGKKKINVPVKANKRFSTPSVVTKERPPWNDDLTRKKPSNVNNSSSKRRKEYARSCSITPTQVGDDLLTQSRRVLEKLKQQVYAAGPSTSSNVGARLYSDGIRRLARNDRLAQVATAIQKPEEWSCVMCGIFQTTNVVECSESIKAVSTKICINCEFNQPNVEQFKPTNLAPASMGSADILNRWVGRSRNSSPNYLRARIDPDKIYHQSLLSNKDLTFKPVISKESQRIVQSVTRPRSASRGSYNQEIKANRNNQDVEKSHLLKPNDQRLKMTRSVSVDVRKDRRDQMIKQSPVITQQAAVALADRLQNFKKEQELRRRTQEEQQYSTDSRTNQPLFHPRVPLTPTQQLQQQEQAMSLLSRTSLNRAQSAPPMRSHQKLLEEMNMREVQRIRKLELLSDEKRREEKRQCVPSTKALTESKNIIQQANEHNIREAFRLLLASVTYNELTSVLGIQTAPSVTVADRNRRICELASKQTDWEERRLDLRLIQPELMVSDLRDVLIEVMRECTTESLRAGQRDLQRSPLTVSDCDTSPLSNLDPPPSFLEEKPNPHTSPTITDRSNHPCCLDMSLSPDITPTQNTNNDSIIHAHRDSIAQQESKIEIHTKVPRIQTNANVEDYMMISYSQFRQLILKCLRKKTLGRSYLIAPRRRPELAQHTHCPQRNPVSEKLTRYHLSMRASNSSSVGSKTDTDKDTQSLSATREHSYRSSTTSSTISRSVTPTPQRCKYQSPTRKPPLQPSQRPKSVDRTRSGLILRDPTQTTGTPIHLNTLSARRTRTPSLVSTPMNDSVNTYFRPLLWSSSVSPRSVLSVSSVPSKPSTLQTSVVSNHVPRAHPELSVAVKAKASRESPIQPRSASRSSMSLTDQDAGRRPQPSQPSSYIRVRSKSVGSAFSAVTPRRDISPYSASILGTTTVGYGLGYIPFWRSQHYDSFRQRVRRQTLTSQLSQLQSTGSLSNSSRDLMSKTTVSPLPLLPCESPADKPSQKPMSHPTAPPLPSESSSSAVASQAVLSQGDFYEESKVLQNFHVYLQRQQEQQEQPCIEQSIYDTHAVNREELLSFAGDITSFAGDNECSEKLSIKSSDHESDIIETVSVSELELELELEEEVFAYF